MIAGSKRDREEEDADGGGGAGAEQGSSVTGSGTVSVQLFLPGGSAGWVIGRRGEQVQRVREASGCDVHVSDGHDSSAVGGGEAGGAGGAGEGGGRRTASMVGSAHAVGLAFRLVWRLVQEWEVDAARGNPYVALSRDGQGLAVQSARLFVSPSAAGALIGKQGTTVQELRERSGADIAVHGGRDGQQASVTIRGSQAQVESGFDAVVAQLLARRGEGEGRPEAAKPASDGPGVESGPFAGMVVEGEADVVVTQVGVPKELVGRLIGRNGVGIKEIRAETGCALVVESDKAADRRVHLEHAAFGPEPPEGGGGSAIRIVTLAGHEPRVRRAIQLVRDRLADAIVRAAAFG
jgi:predicted RNA-binding protein YlqC (UPF0109 family)